MNKYAIGTIVGTALLGLSKRKGSSMRLGRKKVTEYIIRQDYGQSCSFDNYFMPENERIIGFNWNDSQLLYESDEGFDEKHNWETVTDNIEKRIEEISKDIDWDDVFRGFHPNKHEKYKVYYDGDVDNIHEYLQDNSDEYLIKVNNFKAIIKGFPSSGNLGFIYTHTVEPGEQEIAPPKTFEEVWELVNSRIYEKIENEFRYKGIIIHSLNYEYEERWTEELDEGLEYGIDITETIFVKTDDGWKPYQKPEISSSKLRKR